jgi:hypothetical protein
MIMAKDEIYSSYNKVIYNEIKYLTTFLELLLTEEK